MALLNRDQIFAVPDTRETVDVPVPEWGGEVRIQTLTGEERDKFEQSLTIRRGGKEKPNLDNFRARLIALCAVNDAGQRLFSPPDIVQLGKKSAPALQRVFDACQALNKFSDDDINDLIGDFGTAGATDEPSTSV